MKIHIVQKGDTLWKIAKKYGVNFEELKKMNSQLSNPDMIMPGMKVKVPTSGGTIKKGAPAGHNPGTTINMGAKKEMPIAKEKPLKESLIKEAPIKEAPIKAAPIKEVPIAKEKPIIKEAPKAPYTPKMPLQVVPEIDINNYYMMNMTNMIPQPQLPPKPTNILPEIKEVPKKEMPIKEVPIKEMPIKANPIPEPVMEAPIQMPVQDCVPMTPVMPGPGFCPPFGGGFPVPTPYMPFPQMPGGVMPSGVMPGGVMPGVMPGMAGYPPVAPGFAPNVAGAPFVPQHFHDESSSFMPQMPAMNPGFIPGAVQNPAFQQPYVDPAAFGQVPAGYGQMPGGFPGAAPVGFPGAAPVGFPGATPAGFPPGVPGGHPVESSSYYHAPHHPTGFAPGPMYGGPGMVNPYGMGVPYGQMPYGYPPGMGGVPQTMGEDFETAEAPVPSYGAQIPYMQQPYPTQGLPVGTGALDDCGCGAVPAGMPAGMPAGIPAAPTNVAPAFIPPTPPIFSAPYSGPGNVAQPPFMNPYGMGPVGINPYGMQGFQDESS
ncbi:SafA/ExsA family spore coat assembly protein [Neobacillus sp. NRS-1170]|uniref:SafA/ExsA family spore coat assembly protein n=1 Tax=Neobacillus sp. NRS-1170 TaxID=3233898 RepID=UPI003D27CB98